MSAEFPVIFNGEEYPANLRLQSWANEMLERGYNAVIVGSFLASNERDTNTLAILFNDGTNAWIEGISREAYERKYKGDYR